MLMIAEPTAPLNDIWKSVKEPQLDNRGQKFDEDGEIIPNPEKDQRPIQERMTNWDSLSAADKRWYLSAEKYAREALPAWRRISGMHQTDDVTWPSYRAECLNRLISYVYKMIRSELKRHDELPEKEREHRTVYWDPQRSVCATIDLPRSKLSSFSRESTGMSAHELVDHVRVKDIKQKMRDEIRVYAREFFVSYRGHLAPDGAESANSEDQHSTRTGRHGKTRGQDAHATNDRWALARYIKERRREQDFDRNTWAMSFNVPNYHRLYRACILHHRKTPKQLEMAVIDEVLAEFEAALNNEGNVQKNTESKRIGCKPDLAAAEANANGKEPHRTAAEPAETNSSGATGSAGSRSPA